jgi:hypothetical protein
MGWCDALVTGVMILISAQESPLRVTAPQFPPGLGGFRCSRKRQSETLWMGREEAVAELLVRLQSRHFRKDPERSKWIEKVNQELIIRFPSDPADIPDRGNRGFECHGSSLQCRLHWGFLDSVPGYLGPCCWGASGRPINAQSFRDRPLGVARTGERRSPGCFAAT